MSETAITTALRLLQLTVDAATFLPQNADLIDQDAGTGALDGVIDALERGDVSCAMERLDAAVLLAEQPPALPTTGHATKQRKNLLQVAKSSRKLVLLGIKATGGAA
jgi:hypothetical protein